LESIKQLFQVFTNKELFIEWLLAVNISIGRKLVNKKTQLEANRYVQNNRDIDLRVAPESVKSNILYDADVLQARWETCIGCEFFTEDERCSDCGCWMKPKHKLKHAFCTKGKWGKYINEENNGITVTA
jgi:hypothetical protein